MMTANRTKPPTSSPDGFVALVVDNDPASRFILRGLIESDGGLVVEADNGAAALRIFSERQPDIVLLDTTMAETGGFDACTQIQALPNGPVTPVLMITALDDEASVNLALALGAADYVSKPIHPLVLLQRMRRLLQTHRTDAAIIRAKKEWEAAVDAVADIVILTDLSGRIIRCNRVTIQRLDTTYLQLIGCELESVLFKDSGQELDVPFGQSYELQFPALQGWFEARAFSGHLEGSRQTIVYVLKDITERKQLEENVRRSEHRFRALTENISEGIMLYDAVGTILYVSPGVTHLTGYGQEILGESGFLFGHPDDIPQVRNSLIQLMEHPEESVTTEIRLRHKNGSWIWIESSARNMLNEPGITAILVNFRDVTERKQLEVSLLQNEKRFRAMIENSADAIALVDVQGMITYTTPAITDISGYAPDNYIGYNAFEFMHPEDLPGLVDGFTKLLKSPGEMATSVFRSQHTDGSWRWVDITASNQLAEPAVQAIIINFRDVTERKRAEEALRASEARYRTLFEDSPVALWEEDFSEVKAFFDRLRTEKGVTDFRAYFEAHPEVVVECAEMVTVKDVNKAAMKLLGAQRKEQLLGALGAIVSPRTNIAFLEELMKIADGCTHYAFEGPNLTLNGEVRQVSGDWSVRPGYEDTLSRVTVSIVDLTERKRMEAELRARERQLVEAQKIAHLGSWEWDFRTHVSTWTDELYRLCGREPGSIAPSHEAFIALIHPEDQDRAMKIVGQSFQTHEPYDFDCRILLENHKVRWIHSHGEFIKDEIGQLIRLQGTAQDITERKQVEEALRLSEERFQLVTYATNDAVWDVNLQTGQQWWNKGVQMLFGYPPDQIGTDQTWWEAQIHPDDHSKVMASFQAALDSDGRFWSKEYRFRRADGSYAHVFDRGYIIQDEQGRPTRAIGAMMDLSERKRVEEALLKSEELFSKAFHASPVPMTITRIEDGVFIDVNSSWERLLGYSRQAVISRSILNFNIYANSSDRAAIMKKIREDGRVDDFEVKVRTKTEEERDLLMSAQIVEIQGQECLLSTFFDITELRRLHEAMLASQKLADLGTLAAGVAHEMNSPLQVITGLSQSLLNRLNKDGVPSDQLQHNLDVIQRNGWRCAEIVRSLHTYARSSGGPMEPAHLNELVSDGLLLIEHQLKSWANIAVQTDLTPELPPLTCDRNQITQVLINLLTNARDAMPDGGEITITTGYDSKTDQLMIWITDTGLGIPDSIRGNIFNPFFTTKPLGKGTGLGLSIVAGIVRAHGGTIEVESVLRQGTTFTLRFPAKPLKLPVSEAGNTAGRFDNIKSNRLPAARQIKSVKEIL